jgi:glycosyltransferase involved in cell wall biosynthesis
MQRMTPSDRTVSITDRVHHPVRCVDIELSLPPEPIEDLTGYTEVTAVVRLHGEPLGQVRLPITDGRCRAVDIRKTVLKELEWPVVRHLMEDRLAEGLPAEGWSLRELPKVSHIRLPQRLPTLTVAICTRDRADDLAICLDAIMRLDVKPLEVIVVDNAPATDETERLVRGRFPGIRYVLERRPGLDWARNRAILEARGEIVAFTDDDCVVDPGWVGAIATLFADDPQASVVTGLVLPYELETEAQILFERAGGFGRGYRRSWFAVDPERGLPWEYCGAGQFGTGANMAYRRSVFTHVGPFDPALDVGTVTNGGGDLDMFFRVLVEGHTLVYEPAAVVRHRHRRSYQQLLRQIANNGYGFSSVLVRNAFAYPEEKMRIVYLATWWLWRWLLRRVAGSIVRPTRLPLQLVALELWTGLSGAFRYPKARREAARIAAQHGPQGLDFPRQRMRWIRRRRGRAWIGPIGVRTVDVRHPVRDVQGVEAYELTTIHVKYDDRLIGRVTIPNQHRPISARRVREAIANSLSLELLAYTREGAMGSPWTLVTAALLDWYGAPDPPVLQERLPATVRVSIVVATVDRPDGLRDCLTCLAGQETPRRVEVIVVDNNPRSGVTPPVVAEYPGVKLVSEPRRGLAYARNAGFRAATGSVVIATDDDVTMPSDWLERLVAPFVRSDVMVVTGNVLPVALETNAQLHFETYGGLGRGFKRFEVDGDWFESFHWNAAPTWELGATANAAFRASLFSEPGVGLMDEALGVGMPTGCSEDSYLIYLALKAHHTLVYEPAAYVWHQHRATMKALRRQIYGYSKGHVAYHLTTLLRDHDLRSLKRIFVDLPVWRVRQVWNRAQSRSTYPLSLVALEIWGNLVGPIALVRSRLRVRRWGRSDVVAPAPVAVQAIEPTRETLVDSDAQMAAS